MKIKKITTSMAALVLTIAAQAQTMNVVVGNVTYQFPAAQAGDMAYDNDGQTLTIMDKAFTTSDVTQIYIDDAEVTDNTVSVSYNGTSATVTVAGNIAQHITPTVRGAHVGIVQSDEISNEVTYTLTGSSSDGEFYTEGSYKCTVELNGLTLNNQTPVYSGAAIYIKNGKRIDISVKKDTENTLTDCATGDQKACLWVKGHAEFKGKGTLNVSGKLGHAIKTGEYMTVKNCTINVLQAVGDGVHANEYFLMESGELNISGTADDGLQAELDGTDPTGELDGHEGEDSGNIYILGGTINVTTTSADTKGIKTDASMTISGGTINVKVTGRSSKGIKVGTKTQTGSGRNATYTYSGALVISGGVVNASAASHEAIESKNTIDISGGTVYAYASDDAINSGSDFTITGGFVMGNSTGNDGLDANGDFYIKGGTVFAVASTSPEVGVDANTEQGHKLYVSGGTIVAVGGLENGSSLTQACSQASTYTKGAWYALFADGELALAFKVPQNNRMGSPMVVSTAGTTTLKSGVTVSEGTAIWDGFGYSDGATVSGGSAVSLSSYTGGGPGGGGGGPGGGGGGPGGGGWWW